MSCVRPPHRSPRFAHFLLQAKRGNQIAPALPSLLILHSPGDNASTRIFSSHAHRPCAVSRRHDSLQSSSRPLLSCCGSCNWPDSWMLSTQRGQAVAISDMLHLLRIFCQPPGRGVFKASRYQAIFSAL
jgi:hypothetical protein